MQRLLLSYLLQVRRGWVEGEIASPSSLSEPCMIVSHHTAPLDLVLVLHTSFAHPFLSGLDYTLGLGGSNEFSFKFPHLTLGA